MTGHVVVGLAGPIGAGKTTVAARLVATWGFARVAFAEPLKEEVARILRGTIKAHLRAVRPDVRVRDDLGVITPEQWDGFIRTALWQDRDEFARCLLQEWGTDLRRAEHPDYWVNQWDASARQHVRVVADDLRFHNECDAVRRLGGWLIRVRRPGLGGGSVAEHVSETALRERHDWDWVLDNDGTVDDLLIETDRLAKAILAP